MISVKAGYLDDALDLSFREGGELPMVASVEAA